MMSVQMLASSANARPLSYALQRGKASSAVAMGKQQSQPSWEVWKPKSDAGVPAALPLLSVTEANP